MARAWVNHSSQVLGGLSGSSPASRDPLNLQPFSEASAPYLEDAALVGQHGVLQAALNDQTGVLCRSLQVLHERILIVEVSHISEDREDDQQRQQL